MRSDLEAAFRLSQSLPVHTHERVAPTYGSGHNSTGSRRYVQIRGKVYDSISQACKALKVSNAKIYRWAHEGRAKLLYSIPTTTKASKGTKRNLWATIKR